MSYIMTLAGIGAESECFASGWDAAADLHVFLRYLLGVYLTRDL